MNGVRWDAYGHATLYPTGAEDVELLVETMTRIDEHPDELDQTAWGRRVTCGTRACFAGQSLLLRGWKPAWVTSPGRDTSWLTVTATYTSPEGNQVNAEFAAIDLLGLTDGQAHLLFHYGNSKDTLRQMVSDLTEGAYVPPEKVIA